MAIFLASVLLFSTAGVGVVAGQSSVTLTVTVVDGNGDSVSDVDLTASWDGGSTDETTRSNGQALIDVPQGANVSISVHDDDYVRNAPFRLNDASGGSVEVPVSRSGSATVDVVDAQGPVANAVVQLRTGGSLVVNKRIGDDGSVTTRDIEQGEYDVRVWKRGYLRNETTLTVDGDVAKTVRIRQGSRLLGINVTDDHYSPPRPVPNANVTVEGVVSSASTLSNGQTTVQVPVNAEYRISVTKGGYETNATTVRVGESRTTANLTIQRTPAISIEPANGRVVVGETVRVTVTDEYGDPVANAAVSVDGESAGSTNDQGVTSVPIDSAGTRHIEATSGDLTANATVEGIATGGGSTGSATEATDSTDSGGNATTGSSDFAGPGFTLVGALAAMLGVGFLLARD